MGVALLIPVLLIVVFAIIVRQTGVYVNRSRLRWLLYGYSLLLVSSLLMLQVLPEKNSTRLAVVNAEELKQAQWAGERLYQAAAAGKPESIDGVHRLREWNFGFDGSSLKMQGGGVYSNYMTLVERKDDNDGQIEVIQYVTKTIMERIDVTEKLKPVEVTLMENTLTVTDPDHQKIEVARFDQDFTVFQILRRSPEQDRRFHHETVMGTQILYIRIPGNVWVVEDGLIIQFVAGN